MVNALRLGVHRYHAEAIVQDPRIAGQFRSDEPLVEVLSGKRGRRVASLRILRYIPEALRWATPLRTVE